MLFEIGSITKTMTATMVLQHVERGQIQLDQPVCRYVPAFSVDPPQQTGQVTIRHLLTHSSGIDCADDFTDTGGGDDCLERFVAEVVSGSRVLHPPGARWSYCNGAFSLLGRLVEIIDGRPWDDCLISRIVIPLGLRGTTTARLAPDQSVALGHRLDPALGRLVEDGRRMPRSAGAAGNVVATAGDLVRFAHALFGEEGQLLSPPLVEEMLTPQVPMRVGSQGLAWRLPTRGLVVHGGSTLGSTSILAVLPGLGALAVVANGPGAGTIADAVQSQLFGRRTDRRPRPGPGPDVASDACVGVFERRGVIQEFTQTDGQLVARSSFHGAAAQLFADPPPVALEPIGGGRFLGQRPYEDSPTIWDFTDLNAQGVPMCVQTDRLLTRVH